MAFLPLAGLTLLTPTHNHGFEWREFIVASLVFARFVSPIAACLIVVHLARSGGRLPKTVSLWSESFSAYLPSVGMVLAVWFFTAFASLFFIIPGLAFLLGASIALPILVIEKASIPEAIRRSWEKTYLVRRILFMFWVAFGLAAAAVLATVLLVSLGPDLGDWLLFPLNESPVFLPLVFTGSFLYGALICASFEVYCQLDQPELEAPEPTA